MHGIRDAIFATPGWLQHEEAVLNTFRKTTFRATLIAATLAALPLGANAAGLGRISVLSALGQPLRAEIELTATADELASMTAGVAPASAFKEANIAFSPVLGNVNMTVARRGKRAVVQLTSAQAVNDPFLDVLVELNWASGRLLREYTFLLDPPGMPASAASTGVTSAPVREPRAAAARPISAQAPAQSASESAGESSSDSTYRVRRGDTLNKIAGQYKPASVSMDQMLIALYRENREAFIDDNINRLKAGVILNVPGAQQVGDVPRSEAREQVVAHAADFAAYRRRVATRVAQTAAEQAADTEQRSSGRITPLVEEAAQPAETSTDQVRISRTDSAETPAATDGGAAAASNRLQALEEDLVARDKALQEANERLALLEKNITELQQLVEMKSENLAALQQQASPTAPATPGAPAPANVVPPETASTAEAAPDAGEKPADMAAPTPAATESDAAPAASAAEQDALDKELKDLIGTGEGDTAETEEAVGASAPPVAEAPTEEAGAAPTPPVAATAPPTPEPQPGFLEELASNPNALYGGGAALVLLLGYGLYRSRKNRNGALDDTAAASEMPSEQNSVFGATGGQSVDTGNSSLIQTDFSQSGLSAIDADEGVDPVAEADVYMAYGRDAQAEEILLDATKADPARTAIHLKLLEIYAQRKNLQQFETTATELYSVSGGQGEDWDKAVEMGRKLDPDNPLFLKKPVAAETPATPDSAAAEPVDIKPAADVKPAATDEKGGFKAPGSDAGAKLATAALAAGAAAAAGVAVSKDEKKPEQKPVADAPSPAGVDAAPTAAASEAPATDSKAAAFDEPLDFSGAVPDADTPSPSQLKDTWAIPGELNEYTNSEHDADVGKEAPKKAADAATPAINAADLDFDLDEADGAKADSASEAAKKAVAQVDAEGFDATDSALEFDLDLSDTTGKSMAETRVNSVNEDSLAETHVERIDEIDLSSTEAGESSGIDFASVLSDATPDDATKKSDDAAVIDLEKTNFDSSLLDFDLELDEDGEDDDSAGGGMLDTSLDLSDISLELDDVDGDDAAPSEPDSAALADLPSFEEPAVSVADKKDAAKGTGSEDDMMDSLSKSVVTSLTDSRSLPNEMPDSAPDEEVDTKLELARAYEEMGDAEGARELLDEVAHDGNDAQKAQAKSILDRLA